jgi:hypothetical protein
MPKENEPKYVLFEPEYVGWNGLPHAIIDALNLKVPLACYKKHEKIVRLGLKAWWQQTGAVVQLIVLEDKNEPERNNRTQREG